MADIKVEYLPYSYGCGAAILCRGHVDKEAFCKAVWEQEGVRINPANVHYRYCRWVPDSTHKYDLLAYWGIKSGRGAFKVTVVDILRGVEK